MSTSLKLRDALWKSRQILKNHILTSKWALRIQNRKIHEMLTFDATEAYTSARAKICLLITIECTFP